MIFRPELAKKVKAGEKTMTRRRVKADQKDCRYEVGKAYAVQPGRGRSAICRLTVTSVRLERVGRVSFEDAKREGFKTTQEFRDYWRELYAPRDLGCWPALSWPEVWVIGFELGDKTDDRRMLTRSGGTVQYGKARPRKPGALGRWTVADKGDDQDYSTELRDPLDAGEAITKYEQQLLTQRSHENDEVRVKAQRAEAAEKPLADRVEEIEGVRVRRRVDVTQELRVIEERVRRAERALEGEAA